MTTSPITLATWPAPPAATPAERLAQVDRIMARRAMDAHAQAVAEISSLPRPARRARRWWIGGAR